MIRAHQMDRPMPLARMVEDHHLPATRDHRRTRKRMALTSAITQILRR
jgi:hypothetical protein